nr:uncharacterized protein LOC116827401 isoform X4 [Chelonoidis abingdonii]
MGGEKKAGTRGGCLPCCHHNGAISAPRSSTAVSPSPICTRRVRLGWSRLSRGCWQGSAAKSPAISPKGMMWKGSCTRQHLLRASLTKLTGAPLSDKNMDLIGIIQYPWKPWIQHDWQTIWNQSDYL